MTGEHVLSPLPGGVKPLLVAHRARNRIADLRAAELLGIELVEADIRLHLGRLEVRHLQTVGPLPILWDRGQLAAPWRRRLQLTELLEATAPNRSSCSTSRDLGCGSPRRRWRRSALISGAVGSRSVPVTGGS